MLILEKKNPKIPYNILDFLEVTTNDSNVSIAPLIMKQKPISYILINLPFLFVKTNQNF